MKSEIIQRVYGCLNGEIAPLNEINFSVENRAFRYGDAIFETIRGFGTQMPLFDRHYDRLISGLTALQINVNSLPKREVIRKKIEGVITKNRYYKSSRIRLTVFRNDGGLYTPISNDCSYLIEATPIDSDCYELNDKGLIASLFTDMSKHPSIISPFKTANSLMFVMAGLHKKNGNVSEVFIQNSNGLIIEALASNLFWIKNQVLFTVEVSAGCVDGIMRGVMLEIANEMGVRTSQVNGVKYEDLKCADEIFITNAIQGINWIVGVDDQRYYNTLTIEFFKKLTRNIKFELNK